MICRTVETTIVEVNLRSAPFADIKHYLIVSLLENPLLEKVEQNGVNGGKAPWRTKPVGTSLCRAMRDPHFGSTLGFALVVDVQEIIIQ